MFITTAARTYSLVKYSRVFLTTEKICAPRESITKDKDYYSSLKALPFLFTHHSTSLLERASVNGVSQPLKRLFLKLSATTQLAHAELNLNSN